MASFQLCYNIFDYPSLWTTVSVCLHAEEHGWLMLIFQVWHFNLIKAIKCCIRAGERAKSLRYRLIIAAIRSENKQWNQCGHVTRRVCKRGAVRFHSCLAYVSPLDSSGSCSKAETELCKHLLAETPLVYECKAGCRSSPRLPPYSSLASSLHLRVKSPVGSRPLTGSGAAAEPPPRCVAQRVGQPQIHRSLSLSSTVSPTKRYRCLWSYAKAYFCSLLGILTQELLSLGAGLKHG